MKIHLHNRAQLVLILIAIFVLMHIVKHAKIAFLWILLLHFVLLVMMEQTAWFAVTILRLDAYFVKNNFI